MTLYTTIFKNIKLIKRNVSFAVCGVSVLLVMTMDDFFQEDSLSVYVDDLCVAKLYEDPGLNSIHEVQILDLLIDAIKSKTEEFVQEHNSLSSKIARAESLRSWQGHDRGVIYNTILNSQKGLAS